MKKFGNLTRIALYAMLLHLLLPSTVAAQRPEPRDRVVRILAVGNSFSRDAIEQNLYEIAAAAGVKCEIGNLYVGGCSVERHVENLRSDAAIYEYRHIYPDGRIVDTPDVTMREGLCDAEWDYVSVQQASHFSGFYDTYALLPELLEYIKAHCPTAEIVFHQTWAYAADSDHEGFVGYDRDQQTMYQAIMTVVERVATENGIRKVIPAGTAIQNARATAIGDHLNHDGYHLNTLGRYIAACTWAETLLGVDVRGNEYESPLCDRESQLVGQHAAHAAAANPYSVTLCCKP